MKSIFVLAAVTSCLCALGCSNGHQFQDPKFKPAADIGSSFHVQQAATIPPTTPSDTANTKAGPNVLSVNKAQISIQKSALEKEFLLQAELIEQPNAPQFNGMESRVVSFREVDNKIFMVETSDGHTETTSLPQTLLIAQFSIISETDTAVTFDFNQGMSNIFQAGDWKAGDFGETKVDTSLTAVKAAFSYIESATTSQGNALTINQVAQLDAPLPDGTAMQETVRVIYYLSPYIPNPNFKPTVAPATYDRLGYFDVSSLYNSESGIVTYATKRDISKPIVYAISANTPADYKQAVKDGILYWNRALGHNVVQVIDAPVGLSAPNIDYNIVQWVDWNSAGFAYADAQMDPRTGEILHQQIYFTSAWAQLGKQFARQMSQEYQGISTKAATPTRIGLAGFKTQQLCDMDLNAMIADKLSGVLIQKMTPAQMLKVSQDLLREVVAHEVGHTMGLRHNFAGSLAANYALADRESIFNKYLTTGQAPAGLITSSSVMDYQIPLESMLNGDQIARGLPAADYDTKALQVLYYGASYTNDKLPLFCTDSHAATIPDCKRYDAGNSIVEWTAYGPKTSLETLPYTLLFAFQNAKNPAYGEQAVPVDQISPDAAGFANSEMALGTQMMTLFSNGSELLSNSRSYAAVNGSNRLDVRKKLDHYLVDEIKKNGGLAKVFLQTDLGMAAREDARFEKLLADPNNLKGETPAGRPFAFTDADVATMKATVKQFYATLEHELIKDEAKVLAGGDSAGLDTSDDDGDAKSGAAANGATPAMSDLGPNPEMQFAGSDLSDMLADYLAAREDELVIATDKAQTVIKRSDDNETWSVGKDAPAAKISVTEFDLPQFSYPYDVRKIAATFLRPSRAKSLDWGFTQRTALENKFGTILKNSFPPIATISSSSDVQRLVSVPKPLLDWILEALTVRETM